MHHYWCRRRRATMAYQSTMSDTTTSSTATPPIRSAPTFTLGNSIGIISIMACCRPPQSMLSPSLLITHPTRNTLQKWEIELASTIQIYQHWIHFHGGSQTGATAIKKVNYWLVKRIVATITQTTIAIITRQSWTWYNINTIFHYQTSHIFIYTSVAGRRFRVPCTDVRDIFAVWHFALILATLMSSICDKKANNYIYCRQIVISRRGNIEMRIVVPPFASNYKPMSTPIDTPSGGGRFAKRPFGMPNGWITFMPFTIHSHLCHRIIHHRCHKTYNDNWSSNSNRMTLLLSRTNNPSIIHNTIIILRMSFSPLFVIRYKDSYRQYRKLCSTM